MDLFVIDEHRVNINIGFSSSTQSLTYTPDSLDEVEDLYYLVEEALVCEHL